MQLLIVGTLNGQIGAASKIAMDRGAKVTQAESVDQALNLMRGGHGVDLIMIDVRQDIAGLVARLKSERIMAPVVACGTDNDTRAAVAAIKAGAREYVPLPPDAELIAAVLMAVTEENTAIIHKDPAMAEVLKFADQIAPSDASILITGASGTGKEMIARYLHSRSKRKDGRFVAINCAAIPENLLESELFGHEKGAFTGAVARRIGKFEEASNGSLLLDEVSEMDPRLQAKLLRVLQEKEVERIGSNKPVKVNARVFATSNRNMEEAVQRGDFREDLYFRLNVVNLRLPTLTERPGDIEVLADYFIKKYAAANDMPVLPLLPETRKIIQSYTWPGNVRELENTMHRAVLLSSGDAIGPDAIHLTPPPGSAEATGETPSIAGMVGRTVSEVERELIIDTLQHCLGNRTHAANILGISIRTLRNKLKQYTEEGISVPLPGDAGSQPPAA